jgi:membrane-bound lytic murein transglycosylase D
MIRWPAAFLTCVAAACAGRVAVKPDPAPTLPAAPPGPVMVPAPPTLTAGTPQPVAPKPVVTDTTPAPKVVQARDSAADAAVLDSLAKVAPAASLPDVPIEAHPTWDLNVADFADQPRVKYYLDYFVGRAHERFQIWLDRMAPYEDYARAQFAARKLPGDFVYLALIESGYSPVAVSHSAAVGIWQFMVGTGRVYGLRVDPWLDERRDPIKATDAAAHHLDDLTQRFGSHYLAAAAYNAGAGRIGRSLGQINSAAESDSVDVMSDDAFFSLADTRAIRDETKNYVPQLIAAAIIAKEPAKYDFTLAKHPVPFSHDSVIVDGGTGLDLIARLADTTLEALQALNPHLLRMITPPGERYPVRVPIGSASKIASAYTALPPDERHAIETHQVKRGETVPVLAKRYRTSPELIRSANRNARGRALGVGSTIYIPLTTTIPASYLREPDPPRTTRTVVRTYIVRKGETIASVARRAGVSIAKLRSDSQLPANAKLRAGQRLIVRRTVSATKKRRRR